MNIIPFPYGVHTREEYLHKLAVYFDVPLSVVKTFAAMLGPDEDFTGLIDSLIDYVEDEQ